MNYQNLGLYNRLFPSHRQFKEPYRLYSAASQGRYHTPRGIQLKLYAQYDRTDFSSLEGKENRLFNLGEDNIYLNATARSPQKTGGWQWFAGRPGRITTGK